MSSTTLNAVAIDVVGQYGLAGKHLVNAYRLGTQRAVAQLNGGYASLMDSTALPMIDSSIRNSILAAQQQLAGFFIGGVARATEQVDLAIDRVTDGTTQGIKRLGEVGERFETMVGTPVVDTMTKLNMPAAKLSLQIADQVVEGSKRLVERVAAVEDAVAATVAAATTDRKARTRRAASAA